MARRSRDPLAAPYRVSSSATGRSSPALTIDEAVLPRSSPKRLRRKRGCNRGTEPVSLELDVARDTRLSWPWLCPGRPNRPAPGVAQGCAGPPRSTGRTGVASCAVPSFRLFGTLRNRIPRPGEHFNPCTPVDGSSADQAEPRSDLAARQSGRLQIVQAGGGVSAPLLCSPPGLSAEPHSIFTR